MNLEPKHPMLEIINAEKQLWSLIYSKGILHKEAPNMYIQVCLMYEKLILDDHDDVEFQEIEYSLWKLHYKHIHEFRKKISQNSKSIKHIESEIDSHAERYKSFLSEASEFYQNLISKTRKVYGLGEDPLFEEKERVSCDPMKLRKCQYICHRFLVCLGDLARYRELCENVDVHTHNWSVAATYYFKAASSWPDSGNPQNQLAVLAKYIGDDFLALYHCMRSLAVKEPFPDAWNNLILLLEENRSTRLESLSKDALFNFSYPSERSAPLVISSSSESSTSSAKSAFWSLFLRIISFFLVEYSSEEFPYTFASTVRELELLLDLNDIQLKAALEPYQHLDSDRIGPYRALQLVSTIIFIIDTLTTSFDHKDSETNTNLKHPNLAKSAFAATFIILGRLTERCLKDSLVNSSPLLPAVLVFVEWLAGVLDIVQKHALHEEVACAVSYFLDSFVELLNHLETKDTFKHYEDVALWEDFELRGFAPMAHSHKLLNFKTRKEPTGYDIGGNIRGHRVSNAAIKMVKKSPDGFRKWIFYDPEREKFCIEDKEKKTKTIVTEEEEEIIFKPLARNNSAPEGIHDKAGRATSLYPAGPPSLNEWVLGKERINTEKEKAAREFFKPRLTPIDEVCSLSLIDSPVYTAPVPSAPLLPDDVSVFCENTDIHDKNNLGAYTYKPVLYGPSRFTPMMSSSEWLRQFRTQNLNKGNHLVHPVHCCTPGNLYGHDFPRFKPLNPNQIVYPEIPQLYADPQLGFVADGLRRDDLFHNYQRLRTYGCGGDVAENKDQKPSFLQYIKEKEWQMQNQAQVRGPYTRN